MKSRLRTPVLSLLAVAAVACSDSTAPDALLQRDAGGNTSVPSGTHEIRGSVLRYSGTGATSSDTLGTLVPMANAHVAAYYLGPVVDSSSAGLAVAVATRLAIRGSTADTTRGGTPPPPAGTGTPEALAAEARTNAAGAFVLTRLANGVYRVEVTPEGRTSVAAWRWATVRDGNATGVEFRMPPNM